MKKLIIGLLLTVLVLAPVACGSSSPVSFFPVQKSGFDQMDALLTGELELVDGYLRVKSVYSSSEYLLVWPYGFSVRAEGEEIQVLDGDGEVVAVVGGTIEVGGGEVPISIVEKYTGKSLPDDCTGPFWIGSEVIND